MFFYIVCCFKISFVVVVVDVVGVGDIFLI